ncbi:MAG: hypothetical protein RIC80_02860 [Cyclobacteriaceae bacterium]
MSKLKRLLGALSLVALFIFSSCVDDSIAPEVTALRQAQVDLLNAEVAYQDAQTRYQNAQAESQEISNAFNSANNSITLQINQATLDARLATLEVELATAANLLAAQEALAIEAAADLARALATAGLADAAFYLDQWNAVVFGGFTADGHLIFGGTGLLATQALIVDQKAEVAEAELYLSADESVTQAFLDAKLDEALVEAQADLAAAEAALPVQKAVLAALEADDRLAAIAALQESLLPLADDSVAAIAAVEEAQAALDALENIDDDNIATVVAFDELDDADNFPDHRDTWRNSFARDSAAKANIAVFEAEIAAWEAYADSLQAIYDEFYPQFVEDYETTLASYEEDTVETWNNLPSNDAGADELYELEDAYSAYMIEWGLFNAKAVDSDGNPPSSADTTALVNKRVAYDGLNAAQMLNTPRDGQWFNQGTEDLEEYPGFDGNENDQNTWLNPPTALKGARSGGIGLGDGIGGALAAYITASGNDGTAEDAHDDAVRRWEAVDAYYGDIVDEYRGLQAYIDAVKAGTEDTGEYLGSVPQAPLSLTDFEGLQFMTQYFAGIDGFNDDLLETLADLPAYASWYDIFNALFPGYYDCQCSEPAPADPSIAKSIDDLEAEEDAAEEAADDLEYALTIIDQDEIDAYLAALDALDETEESLDAYYQSLVPARLAVDAAEAAQDAITDQQDDIRSQIMDIENACDGFIVNGGNYTECGSSITEQIEAVEATIDMLEGDEATAGSILNLTRGVLEAEIDIELAAQGQLKAEDMVAELQAELEALQTQEAVLQSMADEFQALLEAALAG